MKAVVQRVDRASVVADGTETGNTERGLWILLGVMDGDTEEDADILAKKIANLRIFTDENDKMNLSLLDIGGGALVISQFTLCADIKKGNRPSFTDSAAPEKANELYEYFSKKLLENGVSHVGNGKFGAHMDISAECNGPVTILYDSKQWVK